MSTSSSSSSSVQYSDAYNQSKKANTLSRSIVKELNSLIRIINDDIKNSTLIIELNKLITDGNYDYDSLIRIRNHIRISSNDYTNTQVIGVARLLTEFLKLGDVLIKLNPQLISEYQSAILPTLLIKVAEIKTDDEYADTYIEEILKNLPRGYSFPILQIIRTTIGNFDDIDIESKINSIVDSIEHCLLKIAIDYLN